MEEIRKQTEEAVREFLEVAGLRRGELLVIGCSSSEIVGDCSAASGKRHSPRRPVL